MCLAPDAMKVCIAPRSKSHKRQKEGTVTSYCKAMNYKLKKYATDTVIAKNDGDEMCSTQLSNKLRTKHAKALWNMELILQQGL